MKKYLWSLHGLSLLIFNVAVAVSGELPPFVFGVIADVQYADADTKGSRHYRVSYQKLEACVADLNAQKPAFVVQLGDFIDGYKDNPEKSVKDLDRLLPVFQKLAMPTYHVVGNHCMNAGKENLQKKLELPRFYYAFTHPAAKGWRFVVLDGNDAGYGLVGPSQWEWLQATLEQAVKDGERVICLSHYALIKEAAKHHRMAAKSATSILKLLDETGCVKAWFAGHDHAGGYAYQNGIHHVTFKGMVEGPGKNAYALVELQQDQIVINGFGVETDRSLALEKKKDG